MLSTNWKSEVRLLFKETLMRYPHQPLSPEVEKGYLQDWMDLCAEVGTVRFSEGARRARSYCKFFPMVSDIRDVMPERRNPAYELYTDMQDLERRKASGERFYALADVVAEVARRVLAGEIKGKDQRGQKQLLEWAKLLKSNAKGFSERMLADGRRRTPSELQSIQEIAKKLA